MDECLVSSITKGKLCLWHLSIAPLSVASLAVPVLEHFSLVADILVF